MHGIQHLFQLGRLAVVGTRVLTSCERLFCDNNQLHQNPISRRRMLQNWEDVFKHNAWDSVVWDDVQEAAAKSKVEANSEIVLTAEEIKKLDEDAAAHWDAFYDIHQNKFFKDRNWLFTEFPELACSSPSCEYLKEGSVAAVEKEDGDMLFKQDSGANCSRSNALHEEKSKKTCNVTIESGNYNTSCMEIKSNISDATTVPSGESAVMSYPGESADFRVFEIGCGVGNTIFPILKTNNSKGLFVYGCDFSSHAVDIVRTSSDYDETRCFGFVCDITSEEWNTPFPEGTIDVIVCIFVLSAIHPSKLSQTVKKMASYLRPGGLILFRDYGRYDLAQLRFKKGRCLSENFYVRGDGTRSYFFTQEEIRELMTSEGLEEVQNRMDRRLQVNRGKRLTMYRVWVQAKYRKPFNSPKID